MAVVLLMKTSAIFWLAGVRNIKKLYVNKKIVKTISLLIGIIISFILLYKTAEIIENKTFIMPVKTLESTSEDDESIYVLNNKIKTILLIGIDNTGTAADSKSFRNSGQADFLLLLIFNSENKTYKIMQINRDTMSEIPILGIDGRESGSFTGQLALSYTYGSGLNDSCNNTVRALEYFLYDINIDNYISLTMDAVSILNDCIGGVTVEILDDFSQVDKTLVQGDIITLKGSQALTYVRARSGMDENTNINRMNRQKQYLEELAVKLKLSFESDDKLVLKLFNELNDYMVTDCSINKFSEMAVNMADYEYGGFITIAGESVIGREYMEFYADEDKLQDIVIDLFYK